MTRPKATPTSVEIDAEIERIKAEREAEINRLLERRRRVQAEEDARRGALLREYLTGPHAEDLRRALGAAVAKRDRFLFGLED